jgi:hypothetical protein
MLELAKALKLVAPITMSADAQVVWLQAAVDALEDIRAEEVAVISAELRRTVTRPSQIVPEIAKLVAEHRRRSSFTARATGTCRCGKGRSPGNGRTDVHWIEADGRSTIEWCDA